MSEDGEPRMPRVPDRYDSRFIVSGDKPAMLGCSLRVLLLPILVLCTLSCSRELTSVEMSAHRYEQNRAFMADDVRQLFDPFVRRFQRLPTGLDELTESTETIEWKLSDCYNPALEPMVYRRINDRAGIIYSVGPDWDDDGAVVIYDEAQKGAPSDGDMVILLLCAPVQDGEGVVLLMGYASSPSETELEKYIEELSD